MRDGVNEGVKARLVEEIAYLYTQGGIKRTEMETSFDISTATAERDLSILKRIGIIVFKGAPKTGSIFFYKPYILKMFPLLTLFT